MPCRAAILDDYLDLRALLVLLAANCVVDYCANVVSISLIELAVSKCTRLQFLILAGADLIIDYCSFSSNIFPAGIILSIVAYQFVHPYVLVDLSVLSPEEYGTTALATVFSATRVFASAPADISRAPLF